MDDHGLTLVEVREPLGDLREPPHRILQAVQVALLLHLLRDKGLQRASVNVLLHLRRAREEGETHGKARLGGW